MLINSWMRIAELQESTEQSPHSWLRLDTHYLDPRIHWPWPDILTSVAREEAEVRKQKGWALPRQVSTDSRKPGEEAGLSVADPRMGTGHFVLKKMMHLKWEKSPLPLHILPEPPGYQQTQVNLYLHTITVCGFPREPTDPEVLSSKESRTSKDQVSVWFLPSLSQAQATQLALCRPLQSWPASLPII